MNLDYPSYWRDNHFMRVYLVIFFITIYLSMGYAATEVDERRVEEEKRLDLKTTEAQYYDRARTRVDQEALTTRDFLEGLSSKEYADHRDAAKVLTILLGKEDELTDFGLQRDFFVSSNLLSARKAGYFVAEAPVRRGLFAQMLMKALGIKGGLTLRVLGAYERYCLSELVYEDIMIPGSTREWMSGRELIYTFIQATHFISRYRAK